MAQEVGEASTPFALRFPLLLLSYHHTQLPRKSNKARNIP